VYRTCFVKTNVEDNVMDTEVSCAEVELAGGHGPTIPY
jgi:hypothetical protein